MDERTLYQALAEAPDDEAPLLVFADWLLEHGDPMSEFVALQAEHLKKPLDLLRSQRAQDLLIMNWRRWMGPLHRVLHRRSCVFERGFLREADASVPPTDEPGALALRDAPQWATVRTLKLAGAAERGARVLESPWLRNLKHLRCQADALVRAEATSFSLETLDLTGPEAARLEPRPGWQQLARLALREFDAPLSAVRVAARELHCEARQLEEAIIQLRNVPTLARRPQQVVVSTAGWRLALARDSATIVATVSAFSSLDSRVVRQLGEVELLATFGARVYRGPAKGFDWA